LEIPRQGQGNGWFLGGWGQEGQKKGVLAAEKHTAYAKGIKINTLELTNG